MDGLSQEVKIVELKCICSLHILGLFMLWSINRNRAEMFTKVLWKQLGRSYRELDTETFVLVNLSKSSSCIFSWYLHPDLLGSINWAHLTMYEVWVRDIYTIGIYRQGEKNLKKKKKKGFFSWPSRGLLF